MVFLTIQFLSVYRFFVRVIIMVSSTIFYSSYKDGIHGDCTRYYIFLFMLEILKNKIDKTTSPKNSNTIRESSR